MSAGPLYGLDAELKAKQDEAYDPELEMQVCDWIEQIVGMPRGTTPAEDWLHDGRVLCTLANAIEPDAVHKINGSSMVFKQRENITFFQKFAREEIGVPEIAMFSTDDLFDAKNMNSVMRSLYTFAGVLQVRYPLFEPKLGVAIRTQVLDTKRAGNRATQCGGFAGVLEVQKLTQCARTVGVDAGGEIAADAGGFDADLALKKAQKFDVALEAQVCAWIEAVTGDVKGEQSTHAWLKSGRVLCALANKMKPGSVEKVNTMSTPFMERENITFFQRVARDLGVPESSMFGTDDLYAETDMGTFIAAMFAFGGAVQVACPDTAMPKLGAAMTAKVEDSKRAGTTATSQYEAMERAMEVERPKDMGIVRGAAAAK